MKISRSFRSAYPKLSLWIEGNVTRDKLSPKVWGAFMRYAELNSAKATLALMAGTPPEVHFETMPRSNGRFRGPSFPNRIYLAKAICDRFEKTDASEPRMHILVESTLLHEMVHWGDWKDGVDQKGEEGKAFEKAAYGKDIDRYW